MTTRWHAQECLPLARALLWALTCVLLAPAARADPPPTRPNIIFILTDDLRWDEMDYPFVRVPNIQRIAREGARFTNAFATTPLCSPNRASILTGQYAHEHGITDNTDRSRRSHELVTFPRLLHDAGYETAFIGKWHMGLDDTARPGIDHWVGVSGQGRYLDPEFNVDGRREKITGYFTDILNGFAVDFVKARHEKPYLLYISHKAVHPDLFQAADGSVSDPGASKFIPAERHARLYAGAAIPHRASYGKAPVGKPALLRPIAGVAPLGPNTVTEDETIRNRLRMLAAVDEGVGQILDALEARGELANTVILFTSDEGYFYGEHGLSVERRLAYEESARVPVFVHWPKAVRPGRTLGEMALSIDLAPTILEIAGQPSGRGMHGRSLLPLLRGEKVPWRRSFLIEYFSDTVFPRVSKMGYQCVRTDRWKYIRYVDLEGMDELYDLDADPFEMTNRIGDPAARPALNEMKAELARLRGPQDSLPLRHRPEGGRLRLDVGELQALEVDRRFAYVGGQRFILRETADAEQHFFVKADRAGKVESLYWIQIEELLPGKPGGYDYSADETVDLGGLEVAANVRTYSSPPESDSDRGRAVAFLEAQGHSVADGGTRLRLVYLPQPSARREVMIIYMETDPAARPGGREELRARARAGLTLQTNRPKAPPP